MAAALLPARTDLRRFVIADIAARSVALRSVYSGRPFCLSALRVQRLYVGVDSSRAPVRQSAVVFVLPLLYGERRIAREIAILELAEMLCPFGTAGRGRGGGPAATDEDGD
jgi:hypothetical protein